MSENLTRLHWTLPKTKGLVAKLSLLGCIGGTLSPCGAQDFPVELAQGVMAGEVAATSVILQSRLTAPTQRTNRIWSGILGISGVARFQIATQDDFRNARQTEWLRAIPESDYIIKVKVSGLQPGTRYTYRLVYGLDESSLATSQPASFRTHSGSASRGHFSFAVVTGMNYSRFHFLGNDFHPPYQGKDRELGYPGLEAILQAKPDFFVGTGDNVYYDHPIEGRAETRHQMRKKHHEQYSQLRFRKLFQEVATYWMKDDHDHRFDDSDQVKPFLGVGDTREVYDPNKTIDLRKSGSGFAPSHQLGLDIFREQLPVVDPKDPKAETYRTHRVSQHLQIWFLEGRDYRSPNHWPDGPEKSIWGETQKKWLHETLLESDAPFKILFSPTPMVGPDSDSKQDNHVNPRGFRHEGDAFFEWLKKRRDRIGTLIFVCGDRHWQYHSIHPSGFEEFSAGPVIDENAVQGTHPGDARSSDPEGRIQQPYHALEPTGGFLLISVGPGSTPGGAVADFTFFDEQGTQLYQHRKKASIFP